jgi:FkbM family methyltransferase
MLHLVQSQIRPMSPPAPASPSWLRRAARTTALGLRANLRRLLNLDADQHQLQAALMRTDRRVEEFGGANGRVAAVERHIAAVEGRTQALERMLAMLDAKLEAYTAIAEARDAGVRENLGGLAELGGRTLQATGEVRTLLHEQEANAAPSRAILSQMDAEARALAPQFGQLFDRVRFLEKQAAHEPIYVQAGLNAIVRVGGWDDQLMIAVPSTHVGVLETYYTSGAFSVEPGLRTLIRRELKPTDVALDIGAHVGLHSVVMGDIVRAQGRLYCFEPDPELAAALMQMLIMNGLTRIGAVVNAAVAERESEVDFHRTLHSPESSIFGGSAAAQRDTVRVQVISLDSHFPVGQRVDFAKIDAEGAEPAIFRGMQRVLRENPQLRIAMEFAPSHFQRAGEDTGAFFDTLAQRFAIAAIDDKTGDTAPLSRERALAAETHNLWLTPKV